MCECVSNLPVICSPDGALQNDAVEDDDDLIKKKN